VFLKSKLVQALSNGLWALSAIPTYLVIFDVGSDYQWWLAVLAFLSIPGVGFVASCLNRKVVSQLLTTFQPTSNPPFQPGYILFWILVMFCTLAALWRNHPAKIVALSAWLPNFMICSLVDAYPEAGRTFTSRYEWQALLADSRSAIRRLHCASVFSGSGFPHVPPWLKAYYD
jgi:hypothetical protein